MHMQMLDDDLNFVFDLPWHRYLVPRHLTFTGNLLFYSARRLLISDELTSLSWSVDVVNLFMKSMGGAKSGVNR